MRIHSVFLGIDGEVNFWGQGRPSYFIRLQKCNIHCSYCDIPEAQGPGSEKQDFTIEQIFQNIMQVGCTKITITGGEPLLQEPEIHQLLNLLFPYNIACSVETNGTLSTRKFRDSVRPYDRISLVVDYKLLTKGPGPWPSMNPDAFSHLIEMDWVKILIGDRPDFENAIKVMENIRELGCKARFALSPIHETLLGKELAQWILDAKMWDVTLNCQIHKWLDLA
jgi:7-carboxy-7-deazaguanine synthase